MKNWTREQMIRCNHCLTIYNDSEHLDEFNEGNIIEVCPICGRVGGLMDIDDVIYKDKAEYLCEIASVVWSKNNWLDLKRLPKPYVMEFTYEDWYNFYNYIYDVCSTSDEDKSLLEIIYRYIDVGLMDMFAEFLSTYKK